MGRKFFIIIISGLLVFSQASNAVASSAKIKRLVSDLYDKKSRAKAERRLAGHGTEVTEAIIPALQDNKNEDVQISALKVLGETGDSSAEDEVVKLLASPNYRVRQEAARTLSVIGQKESSVEPLKALLMDYNPGVRYNAIKALAKIAPKNEVDSFIMVLGDYDPRVRTYAVVALGNVQAQKAVPYLYQMTRDFDPAVRMAIVESLGKINTDDCVEPLAVLATDPDINIRKLAVKKLAAIKTNKAEEPLVRAAESMDSHVAGEALLSLCERKSSRALEIAREKIDTEYMAVKLAAIEVIGKMGEEKDKKTLGALSDAESTNVRKKAQEAIKEIDQRK